MSNNRLNIKLLDRVALTAPYRLSHEGWSGGASVECFSIKNDSSNHLYSNVKASIKKIAGVDHATSDFFTDNGWSIKLITKDDETYPTEAEWSETLPNTQVLLDDIGGTDIDGNLLIPDTDGLQYLFVRVFCPGHTDPGQYKHTLSLTYNSINTTS